MFAQKSLITSNLLEILKANSEKGETVMKEPKFLKSKRCENTVEVISFDREDAITCCGEPMVEMKPNTSEGAAEKHLPVIEVNGNTVTVKVGSVFHPMTEEHSITWVYLETKEGCQRKNLPYTGEPVAVFALTDSDKPVAAYAYCNLHGFWKTEYKG